MTDPDFEDLLPLLSVPAATHDPGPAGLSRRRFLQGILATTGAVGISGTRWARDAFASPIAATDGVLVMVMLGGGVDGLHTLAPITGPDRSTYQSRRGPLALSETELLPAADGYGFHPNLPRLHARFSAGRVAVVRGVGQPAEDLSHFTSMATFMAGTAGSSRSTGWLGRFLDGVTEFDSGMRGITFGSSVPLHLLGQQAKVTAVPNRGGMWGSDPTERWERSAFAAVEAFAAAPTGLSGWGDRVAATGKAAIGTAQTIEALYHPEVATEGLVRDLTLAARLVNADLGTRVISVTLGGWDTHANQLWDQGALLAELDAGIEAFFATLAPDVRDQTVLATFSEFGRRLEGNDSNGTDHGRASLLLVAGENVRGGLHGAAPSLTGLDGRGNLVPSVDFRSVYATLLDGWLAADADAVLGGHFEPLDLFTSSPGGPRTPPPPPPPPNPAAPFADWTSLVRQQYLDLLLVTPTAERMAPWISRLQGGTTTPVDLITEFMGSSSPRSEVHPVLRSYWVCLGRVPTRAELATQVAARRTSGLTKVGTGLVGSSEFRRRHGSMTDEAFVRWLYRAALGTTPTSERVTYWRRQLALRAHTRGSLLAHFVSQTLCVTRYTREVQVGHLYVGMLHRPPTSAALTKRVGQLRAGTPLRSLVVEFFGTREYADRVT